MSGELIREASDSGDLPMCPMSMGAGKNTEHAIEVLFENRLYEAMKDFRDEDGEYADPAMDKLYNDIAYSSTYSRMHLHVERTQFVRRGELQAVESWYYRCHLCGFVLPTQPRDWR